MLSFDSIHENVCQKVLLNMIFNMCKYLTHATNMKKKH